MVTSRDVQEIVSKLSYDKAKAREEGIKLLNTWLEGERLVGFCKYIGRNTSVLKPNEIPLAETWPFLITLLTQAILAEVLASKQHLPKFVFAKTLRIVVQRAEDVKIMHLLSVAKLLFNHTWDVPSFQSEYGIILRHLLAVKHYQFHMRKRDEGKILCKLIECINTYLSKDGPNLGCRSLEIHDAVHQFIFRCWITTHDRSLKDALVLYARLQLKLLIGAADGNALLEQLLDIISKELDQLSTSSTNVPWSDTNRDDKRGILTNSHFGLVELAALVFCRACVSTSKAPVADKLARREHAAVHLNEQLIKGKWLWSIGFPSIIWLSLSRPSVVARTLLLFCMWSTGVKSILTASR